MKKIFILLLILPLVVACSNDDDKENESQITKKNFHLTIYCNDYKKPNGDFQQIPVTVHLFKDIANFPTDHDIKYLTNTYNIFDIQGNKHHAQYSFGVDNSLINIEVTPGEYYVIALIKETGHYSVKNVIISSTSPYEDSLIFLSAMPNNSFEEWN